MRGPAQHISLTNGGDAGTVDLGNEPPILADEGTRATPARRSVSLRWLGGTVLTGLTSVFLMGGALMAALDNPNQFATRPDLAKFHVSDADEGGLFGQKSDRIQATEEEEEVATRQILQVSTVTRQGERDFIKLRPFAKITATLSSAKEDPDIEIPAYDVLRLFADSSKAGAATASSAESGDVGDGLLSETSVDGEVSVKVSALPIGAAILSTVALDKTAIEQVVRAASKVGGGGDIAVPTALAYADDGEYSGDFDMVEDGEDDPFAALGVTIVPENVSSIARSDMETIAGQVIEEKIISVTGDEKFLAALETSNFAKDDASEITAALSELIDLSSLASGNKVRIGYTIDENDGVSQRPIRVSVYDNGVHQATVARSDANNFVRADEPASAPVDTVVASQASESKPGAMPKVYDAVYRTALEQQMPPEMVDQLIRIFAFDVDFQARASYGDSLEVFHSLPDPDDRDASEPEILFAALNIGGVAKRLYRFRTADDGDVDYYDEEGKSAKKFLMRKPVSDGVLRSRFGMRKHPITKRRRQHGGVDYAAPRGTPIFAAGNGRIERAERTRGYGNLIVIKHTNGYETRYAHQHKFAKGIAPGIRVRQGQVIGYVGSTGLSTGNHLHFEIRVNKKAVDPLRIRLPRGRVLEGELLATFENERSRIDDFLGNQEAPTTVASRE